MYREVMQDREGFTDISELGVFCRVCHKWNTGQSDSCSHCQKRLLSQRPLAPSSVDSWVEGQINEYDALGIPLLIDDEGLLRRWAAFDPANPGIDQTFGDAATHPLVDHKQPTDVGGVLNVEYVRSLTKEHDLKWREAWTLSQRDFNDDDIAAVHRRRAIPWRIAATVSGGLFLTMLGLTEWMWRTTAGTVSGRNAFGALAVLFALPLLGLIVAMETSLIGLGINTTVRLERIASWSGAALLIIWLGWPLTQI